jgi:colanic acid/amylovoran biosynthesis glycosyltransferase
VLTVAYLANQFPVAVEPYVGKEIEELRRRGVRVIPGSVRKLSASTWTSSEATSEPDIPCLQPIRARVALRAFGLVLRRWHRIAGLVTRLLLRGNESPRRRLKGLLHTCLGVYYAALLQGRGVDHIHVHHGYFGSWIAMVAAKLRGVSFSMTLHGSDLLINGAYLNTKLENCRFCVTISEYNRRYILEHFPVVDPHKIVISRLGVDVPERRNPSQRPVRGAPRTLSLLAVGRLHEVKDHAFLVRACARLRDRGLDFKCAIAGEGPERQSLELLIQKNRLQDQITLLGHVARNQMDSLYRDADLVVLTSRSEGLPLVLMEAMVRERIVLAPAITGIPEIIIPEKTGFLYAPGSLTEFVAKILYLRNLLHREHRDGERKLDWIRHAARVQVLHNFDRETNVTRFGDRFVQRVAQSDFSNQDFRTYDFGTQDFGIQDWSASHEDFVLQQI